MYSSATTAGANEMKVAQSPANIYFETCSPNVGSKKNSLQ